MLSLQEQINDIIDRRVYKGGGKTPRNTNSRSNPNRSNRRPNPMIAKAGITRSGKRSYKNGGEIK